MPRRRAGAAQGASFSMDPLTPREAAIVKGFLDLLNQLEREREAEIAAHYMAHRREMWAQAEQNERYIHLMEVFYEDQDGKAAAAADPDFVPPEVEVRRVEAELQDWKSVLSKVVEGPQKGEATPWHLEQLVVSLRSAKQKAKEAQATMEQKVEEARIELARERNTGMILSKEREEAREALERRKDELSACKAELSKRQSAFTTLQRSLQGAELARLRKELANVATTVASAESVKAELEESYTRHTSAKNQVRSLEATIRTLEAHQVDVEQNRRRAEAEKMALVERCNKQEAAELRARTESSDAMKLLEVAQADLTSAQEQLAAKDVEITGLHDDILKVQDQLSSHLVKSSSPVVVGALASPMPSTDKALASKLADAEQVAELLRVDLKSKEKAWDNRRKVLEGRIQGLEAQVRDLQSFKITLHAPPPPTKSTAVDSTRINALRRENEQLRSELISEKEQINLCTKRFDEQETELHSLQEEKRALHRRCAEVEESAGSSTAVVNELRGKMDEAQVKLEKMQKVVQRSKELLVSEREQNETRASSLNQAIYHLTREEELVGLAANSEQHLALAQQMTPPQSPEQGRRSTPLPVVESRTPSSSPPIPLTSTSTSASLDPSPPPHQHHPIAPTASGRGRGVGRASRRGRGRGRGGAARGVGAG